MNKRPASPLPSPLNVCAIAPRDEMQFTAFLVLSSPPLLRSITAFQGGLSLALYAFWAAHDPNVPRKRVETKDVHSLLKTIAKVGSRHHLELLQVSRFYAKGGWRVPNLSRFAPIVVEYQRADLLEWVIANEIPLGKATTLWKSAVSTCWDGNTAVLELLNLHCPISQGQAQGVLVDAIKKPTRALLEWLLQTFPMLRLPWPLTSVAASCGDIDALRFLLEGPPLLYCDWLAFREAYEKNHLDVLDYLVTKHAQHMGSLDAEQLVIDPRPEIRALVEKNINVFVAAFKTQFLDAVINGEQEKMDDIYARSEPFLERSISIDRAGEWVGLAGLKFLHDKGFAVATIDAMDFAAQKQRWDVVEFLHIHRTEGCTTRAADAAAKAGNIKWLGYLLENRPEGSSTEAMDYAAEQGSFKVLQFLYRHSKVGCTTKAMDRAAKAGHYQIVKFLHENRSEGCTTDAMDSAAQNGLYEIVRYLCKHRVEGCTVGGIRSALQHNHLRIVHLLYDHYPHHFGPHILHDLLLRGAFEIFLVFRKEYPTEAQGVIERVLFDAVKEFELRTIVFIMHDLGKTNMKHRALIGTSACVATDKSQWRKAIDAITRPPSDARTAIQSTLHPFLRDPRTPRWALDMILVSQHDNSQQENERRVIPMTWAIRAVFRRDPSLLDVIRDVPPSTKEPLIDGYFDFNGDFDPFSFAGAREQAIRLGEISILEWLLTNIDLPIEPTLLSEAVYYHKFEIAAWLVDKYPRACTKLDWTDKGTKFEHHMYGLHDGLLEWLGNHEAVRSAVSFEGIVDYAARTNDVVSLKQLYEWYPEHFKPRSVLIDLADREECRDTINFLLEIGWSADVFLYEELAIVQQH